MQLMVLVLNKVECLGKILADFMEQGIGGATVIDSMGMLNVMGDSDIEPPPIFGSLRKFLQLDNDHNKTVFAVVTPQQVQTASAIINAATGGLGKPNTGILFTIDVGYTEGITQ